jgi:hypothetical protein
VTFSAGWLGAIAAFLVLAVAGLTSQDAQTVRAAYLALNLIGWYVLVPCSLASLVTGLVQSLATEWGLFRHYWVLVKFLLTIAAVALLLVHMQPVERMSGAVAASTLSVPTSARSASSLSQTPVSLCWCCSRPRRCRCTSRGG